MTGPSVGDMKRDMEFERGEFHWRNGVFWRRESDGAVRLRIAAGGPFNPHAVVLTIPPNEWQSIIAHVSAKGSTSEGYAAAEALHV